MKKSWQERKNILEKQEGQLAWSTKIKREVGVTKLGRWEIAVAL